MNQAKFRSFLCFPSPEKSMIILVVLIFVIEFGLMSVFHSFSLGLSPLTESLLDTSFLTLFMLPAIWLLMLRPLRQAANSEAARAETIISHSSNGIISFDQQMEIQSANYAATQIFGYTEKELVINQKLEILTPEFRELKFEKDIFYQTIGKKKDGSKFYLEISFSPINYKDKDFYVGFFRDITKENLFNQARNVQLNIAKLLTEEDLYDDGTDDKTIKLKLLQIVCSGMDWVLGEFWDADLKQDLLSIGCQWNKPEIKAEQFYNESRELIFRRTDKEGLPWTVWTKETPIWINDAVTNSVFIRKKSAELAGLRSAFGMPIVVQQKVIGVMICYSPKIWNRNEAFLTIMADVENMVNLLFERIHLQKLVKQQQSEIITKSKFSALGEMAAGIAHEINNPLAIISLLAEKLSSSADAGLDQHLIKTNTKQILSATTRAAKIIKGLRTFSRDGSNDLYAVVSLKNVIDETLVLCEQRLKNNEVKLLVDEIPIDVQIECNSTQISQVILNLINNAFDAIAALPEKWIKLNFRDNGDVIEIFVTDSGSKISEDVRDRLFQPFFTTKEVGKGTGLGLSISRGIIHSHGGSLSLDTSSPNTCFVVTLPKQQSRKSLMTG